MRTETRSTTKWRVPPLAWLPIALAIGAESISNALRAYGLGSHLERFTVTTHGVTISLAGGVLVLAAVAVSLSQARAAWIALTPMAPARQRIVAGLAAVLLLAISVIAMASTILEAQRTKVTDEGGERAQYTRVEAAYETAAAELERLGGTRTTAEVRAAMDAAPVKRPVFLRTKECTELGEAGSYEFKACQPILDLRKEMAGAIRKQELGQEVPRLMNELAGLKRPEAESTAEGWVSGIWAWIMGLGVVAVATFGTVIFARVETVTAPIPTGTVTPIPPPPAPPVRMPIPPHRPTGGMREDALADLKLLLKRGTPIDSQDQLAERWGRSKGWVSLRLKEWEAAGEIPPRVAAGRCKTFETA